MTSDRSGFKPIEIIKRAGLGLLFVAGIGVFFCFEFPRGAISSLINELFGLPGSDAEVTVVAGPIAIVFILVLPVLLPRGRGRRE